MLAFLRRAERRAPSGEVLTLDDGRFWSLIDEVSVDLSLEPLSKALRGLTWDEIFDFRLKVSAKAAALDGVRRRMCAESAQGNSLKMTQTVDSSQDVTGTHQTPSACSQADFEELAVTVVALGYGAWDAIRDAPELLVGSWPIELGRRLVAVVDAALQDVVLAELKMMSQLLQLERDTPLFGL